MEQLLFYFLQSLLKQKKMFQIYYKGGVVTCKKHLCTLHNTSTHSSNWTTLYCFDWILLRFYIFFLGFFCRDLYFEVFFLDIEQICCLISSYYDFDWARRCIWLLCDVERRFKKIKNAHHLKVTGIVLSVKGHKTVKKT